MEYELLYKIPRVVDKKFNQTELYIWKLPNQSELTFITFYMDILHLGSEDSTYDHCIIIQPI